MPFRLKEVLVTFQRFITKVLRPYLYEFIMIYLNDIIIFSNIMKEHIQHMRKVLKVLKKAEFKLKLKKYKFAKK